MIGGSQVQASVFVARVLPSDLFGGGGGAQSQPRHTPNIRSSYMDERVSGDENDLDLRMERLQAEVLEARLAVLRIRAVLQGLAAAERPRPRAG